MGKKQSSSIQVDLDAETFLHCFIDKVRDVRSSTSGLDDPDFTVFNGSVFDNFSPLTTGEVRKLVLGAPNKACGLDPAPTWLVREFIDELAPFFTILFNKSLCCGCFPKSFRIAEITPLLKKSTLDATIPQNYRPISNLPFVSKVLERAVNEQLLAHLSSNGLLPEHQSAYRRSHSTETALLKVTSDARLAADRGQLTLLGMLDLSAAFDCVDHGILMRRLQQSFGVTDYALSWIESYLIGRSQYVRYNGLTSETTVIDCGVPQGSVLGPLYFVLYVSDIFQLVAREGFLIHGYADDMQIYDHCFAGDMNFLTTRFVTCIGNIQTWMSRNRLKLNASKTEFIWFGSARRLPRCTFDSLVIGDSTLHQSASVRNLGVILDPSLSLSIHISKLVSTSFYHMRQLRCIRHSLTVDSCHALVRALIISRLDYCNGLLGGAPAFLLDQLSGVLRAAARLVLELPRRSRISDVMKSQLHWLDIPARVTFKLCVLAHRCLHGSAPPYLSCYCIQVSSIEARSLLRSAASGIMFVPQTNTLTIGAGAFAIAAPTAWNSLPAPLRNFDLSLPLFRKKLKTHLFNM